MKLHMLTIALCFSGTGLLAQKVNSTEVPMAVKNSLEKNMHVKDATWDKEDGNYEANFKKDGKETSVVFDNNGVILETEVEINSLDLPGGAKEILKQNFSGYKTEEISRIDAKGIITYEVAVEKKEKAFELLFDDQGKLLKKEEEKNEPEDKD